MFAPADEQAKLLKQLVKFGTNSENMVSHSFENKELEQADPYRPFVLNVKVKSPELMELAGEKIMIKIGAFVGNQVQMYDNKERKNAVELDYPHALKGVIELTIPECFTARNVKDLAFNEVYKEKYQLIMGFVSTCERTGSLPKVTACEGYKNYLYPWHNTRPSKK